MTWIAASDPLALVYIQGGQIPTPANPQGAQDSNSNLDVAQQATKLGDPVPVVFARRRDNAGGVLISPGATEARFENNANNETGVYYHLVLGEGFIGWIAVKDLFQGPCRVGVHSQTYNRRAGLWDPGNYIYYINNRSFTEAPYYCGIVGTYPDMSTLSFHWVYPEGDDKWKRQVHVFIREGMYVTRLEDGVYGPSDSFADLVKWVYQRSARVPDALIDNTALTAADLFLRVNGFRCNANIKESQNISDFLSRWAPYFLLKETRNNGRRGLRPLLPVTSGGAIDTSPVSWKYSFTEDDIVTGSFELQYSSLSDRQPFVVQVIWRQQLEDDFGINRTAEIRYGGTALAGPYEQHDLSAFCTTELHAVKVGAYILSKRVRTTHTLRFTAKPQIYNVTVQPGDIIHVSLSRQASVFGTTQHEYLYQVERITRTLQGDITYEAIHFPIDEQRRSLVALDVVAATPTGALLPSNKTGLGCDANSPFDNTVPPETGRNDAVRQKDPGWLVLGGSIISLPLPNGKGDDGLDDAQKAGLISLPHKDGKPPSNPYAPGEKVQYKKKCINTSSVKWYKKPKTPTFNLNDTRQGLLNQLKDTFNIVPDSSTDTGYLPTIILTAAEAVTYGITTNPTSTVNSMRAQIDAAKAHGIDPDKYLDIPGMDLSLTSTFSDSIFLGFGAGWEEGTLYAQETCSSGQVYKSDTITIGKSQSGDSYTYSGWYQYPPTPSNVYLKQIDGGWWLPWWSSLGKSDQMYPYWQANSDGTGSAMGYNADFGIIIAIPTDLYLAPNLSPIGMKVTKVYKNGVLINSLDPTPVTQSDGRIVFVWR